MAKKSFIETLQTKGIITGFDAREIELTIKKDNICDTIAIYRLIMAGKLGENQEEMLKSLAYEIEEYYGFRAATKIKLDQVSTFFANKFEVDVVREKKFIPFSYNTETKVATILLADTRHMEDVNRTVKKVYPECKDIKNYFIFENSFLEWFAGFQIEADIEQDQSALLSTQIISEDDVNSGTGVINLEDEDANDSDIVKLVSIIFTKAYILNASDIHIEPLETRIRVRYRIDGVLHQQMELPIHQHQRIVNRIKVMSGMNITNMKTPDGANLSMLYKGNRFDLRISTLPTPLGEKVTARLLNTKDRKFNLNSLELPDDVKNKLLDVINLPSGIILVVGATGSGKSTTLFTVLSALNTPDVNIITIEDPVEYKIPGVTQVQVNNAVDLTFATTFREVLRQDPDIVMVGEIRDEETAQIAVQASMSGHLVLSTLHANNSCSAVARMGTMGVKAEDLSNSLVAVVSQILVRKLCPDCKKKYKMLETDKFRSVMDEYEDRIVTLASDKADAIISKLQRENKSRELLGKSAKEIPSKESITEMIFKQYGVGQTEFFMANPQGCKNCNYTGYHGRVLIPEFLTITEDIRNSVQHDASVQDIEKIALKEGMLEMRHMGITKVISGVTSFQELHDNIHFKNIV